MQTQKRLPVDSRRLQDKAKILIGICSHGENRPARDAIRETWMCALPLNIKALFFAGRIDPGESQIVDLKCADHYEALPGKVQAFFRYALQHEDFDYLFKCDDDTYLVADRLEQLLDNHSEIVGDGQLKKGSWFCGGAGYLLSRNAVEVCASAAISPLGAEDVIFSNILRQHGLSISADSRLRADARILPLAHNELITCHHLDPTSICETHLSFQKSFSHLNSI
jgi:hypothetical protein